MNIALCTLCLNESEFLEKSYEQHKDWPGLIAWVFVEAADPKYAQAAPEMVSNLGLSVDNTSEILTDLAARDPRVHVINLGWMVHPMFPEQNKCTGRNQYLNVLEKVNPTVFLVVDADEFYTHHDQQRINELYQTDSYPLAWRFKQRHIWKPPSISDNSLFDLEVVGGYWDVPHTRLFRWRNGIRYKKDHNVPQSVRYSPMSHLYDGRDKAGSPECVHLGFARASRERMATNRYYRQRGEGVTDGRQKYVVCRGAWETWQPGMDLPAGARVVDYTGQIPECYQLQKIA